MKRALRLFLCMMVLAGCGPKNPEQAEFKGTWKHTSENGLTGAKEDAMTTVTAKANKFRIVTGVAEEGEVIDVYDGETLFRKSPYGDNAQQVKEHEVSPQRFWSNAYQGGSGKPGGTVCGRDAVFSIGGERRPDGEMSQQVWLDAKTGVLLKSVMTVYSSQVNSTVLQETWECQSIDYSPISDSVFLKPA